MKNHKLVELLSVQGWHIVTMESCTGGALANAITNVPGSSAVLMDSFVTYSNEAKIKRGVSAELIDKFTVYSLEVAEAMARQAVSNSVAVGRTIGVGITGSLTREDPNNPNSVPGKVYIGIHVSARGDGYGSTYLYEMNVESTDREQGKQEILEEIIPLILKYAL